MNPSDSKKLEEIQEIVRQELNKSFPQVVLNRGTLTNIAESIEGLYVPLEMQLEASRKIRRYSAFVLTGNENADLQLAADHVKTKLAEQDREIEVLLRQASDREMWKANADKAEARIKELQESNKSWLKVNADVIEERNKAEAALEKEIDSSEFWRVRHDEQKARVEELEAEKEKP